ncbi:MAG: hypothetical protein R3A47_06435 [Polyangiales bacterium]
MSVFAQQQGESLRDYVLRVSVHPFCVDATYTEIAELCGVSVEKVRAIVTEFAAYRRLIDVIEHATRVAELCGWQLRVTEFVHVALDYFADHCTHESTAPSVAPYKSPTSGLAVPCETNSGHFERKEERTKKRDEGGLPSSRPARPRETYSGTALGSAAPFEKKPSSITTPHRPAHKRARPVLNAVHRDASGLGAGQMANDNALADESGLANAISEAG